MLTRRTFLLAVLLAGCAPPLLVEGRRPKRPKPAPPPPVPPPAPAPRDPKPGDTREAAIEGHERAAR